MQEKAYINRILIGFYISDINLNVVLISLSFSGVKHISPARDMKKKSIYFGTEITNTEFLNVDVYIYRGKIYTLAEHF